MNCPHCGKELPIDRIDRKAVEAAQQKLIEQRKALKDAHGLTHLSDEIRRVSTEISTKAVPMKRGET